MLVVEGRQVNTRKCYISRMFHGLDIWTEFLKGFDCFMETYLLQKCVSGCYNGFKFESGVLNGREYGV